jgi:murein DD-endopeptidase MepM/ murein hydrolase activator NlpD
MCCVNIFFRTTEKPTYPQILLILMKKCLPLFLILLTAGLAHAQQLAEEQSKFNIFKDGKMPHAAGAVPVSWNINDSLSYIPSYDLYCDWNTDRVHPYKEDLRHMKDTVPLVLVFDTCDFVAPYVGRKTSDFGYRRYRYHYGVDVKLYSGEEVKSAFEGVVRIAQYDGDYGKVVVIRHENGLETLYAHLSKLKVKEGDRVEAGDLIGLGGNTGRSTGSHLHFEVRYKGEPIDPNALIEWETGYLCHDTLLLNQEHFEYLVEVRKRKYHKIRSGDTLSGIARRYGTSVSKLCRLNGIRSTTTLRIGRTLRYN